MSNHTTVRFDSNVFNGNYCKIYGDNNHIHGNHNKVYGNSNTVIGNHNKIEGSMNFQNGNHNKLTHTYKYINSKNEVDYDNLIERNKNLIERNKNKTKTWFTKDKTRDKIIAPPEEHDVNDTNVVDIPLNLQTKEKSWKEEDLLQNFEEVKVNKIKQILNKWI